MALSLYTPSAEKVVHETAVDLISRSIDLPVHIVQYDDRLPIIAITVYKNGQLYVVPTSANANIRWGKPDGTFVYNPALGANADRTVVYFEISVQMALLSGIVRPIIEFDINGTIAGSSAITVVIERNPVQQSDIESSTEYKTVQQLVQKAAQSASSAAKSATSAARSATEAASAAQSAITAASTAADAADSAADSASKAKLSQEAAAKSETAAKTSQEAAAKSETAAKTSQEEAAKSASAAKTSQEEAAKSASAAKNSQDAAAKSAAAAKDSEIVAVQAAKDVQGLKESLLHDHSVCEPLLDSSGDYLLDSSGNRLESRVVFADNTDLIQLRDRYEETADTVDDLVSRADMCREFQNDLLYDHSVCEPLLDSSGNPLTDTAGNYLESRTVFADEGDVHELEQKINNLQTGEQRHDTLLDTLLVTVTGQQEFQNDLLYDHSVCDILLDSDGKQLLASSGNVMESRFVFVGKDSVTELADEVSKLVTDENRQNQLIDKLVVRTTEQQEFQDNLRNDSIILDLLADSNDFQLLDNSGNAMKGQQILVTMDSVITLENRLNAVERFVENLIKSTLLSRVETLEQHSLLDHSVLA